MNSNTNPMRIYTDASFDNDKQSGVAGLAAVLVDDDDNAVFITGKPVNVKTITEAELLSILLALEDIPSSGEVVHLCTDSKNAVELLTGVSKYVPFAQLKIKKRIFTRMKNKNLKVTFEWIKRDGNRVADALAFLSRECSTKLWLKAVSN